MENESQRTKQNDIPLCMSSEEPIESVPEPSVLGSIFGLFSRCTFQRLCLLTFSRLIIYSHKLYQDVNAVELYYEGKDFNFLMISIISLVAPPLFYAIFLIGSNLAKDDVIKKKEVTTRTINGFLLIPWQVKRHLDLLHFSSQRVCNWVPPAPEEDEAVKIMQMNAEVLEFFEDFYAGFLQLVLQLYIFFATVSWLDTLKLDSKPIISQIIGSGLSILSMMIAVRRRDDGKLTGALSFLGWLSLITSRVLLFSLVSVIIHSWLAILCLIHVLAFSIWIYNIAIESYQISSSSLSATNAQWTSKRKRSSIAVLVFLFFGIPSLLIWPIMFQLKERKRPLIFLLVITLENLILLGIWLFAQRSQLFADQNNVSDDHMTLIIGIVLLTLAGVFLLLMYIFCKPKYADQVVLYEIRQGGDMDAPELIKLNETSKRTSYGSRYGIFYEFCDIVFKLPSSHKISTALEEVRRLQTQMK